jgi:hypothetical protein
MNLALVTSNQKNLTDDDTVAELNIGPTVDQSDVSASLRRVIERSPTRYKLNLLAILWPPVMTVLECVTRRARETGTPKEAEEIVGRALMAGLRAADAVGDYTAPSWPMRNVDAFMVGVKEYANGRNVLPCKSATTACEFIPACRSVPANDMESAMMEGASVKKRPTGPKAV